MTNKARNLKSGLGAGTKRNRVRPPGQSQEESSLMNVFPRSRALNALRALWIPAAMLLFLLPTLLSAQDVPYTGNGIMTVTGSVPIYNGPYVLQQSDYGFFWLDTSTLRPGHVQAVSKCVSSLPPSDSGIYILGDCNSITSISSSGNTVLVRVFGSQCGAQTRGCGGPRDNGHARFSFALGTWQYLGEGTEIPNSTQTTDPQGRTWTVQPTDTTQRHFMWHATGGTPPSPSSTPTPAFTPTPTPTPTPGPGARATNLSSQDRGDPVPTNYYGDKWQLQDISNPNPTRTDWDFNYKGAFVPDEGGSPASEGSVTGYFPCDPSGVGTFRTGASCMQSLGLSNPLAPALGSYQFALLSSVSGSPFVSPAFQVSCPQVGIVGYTGFTGITGTCAETGGTLTVARGGVADARISKGNTTDPATQFDWTFPGSSAPNVSGPTPGVPNDATTFTVTITFPGGYQATAAGTVVIVTSTPVLGIFTDSALTVWPFFGGGAFQLTAGRTYYLKDTESAAPASAHFFFNNVELPGSPTAGPGPLSWIPTAACPSNCSVKVSVGSISNSVPVAISLAVGPTPVPTPVPTATPPAGGSVTVSVAGPTSGSRATPLNFTASASGGAGGYTYAWTCQYNALGGSSQFVAGSQTTTCTYASVGAYVVMAKVTDAVGATGYSAGNIVTITGLPAPSGAYTVSGATPNPFAARYEAPAGTPITFTATEASATYSWNFGDGTSEQTTKSMTHAFRTSGSYSAILTVRGDGVTTSGTVSTTINLFITPPSFRAAIVPGAEHLDDGTTTWGTDVSITNGGTASMSIGLAFVPLVPESAAPPSLDLTQLNYGAPIALSPGASFSVSDVVAFLNGGNNKGTLVIKYEAGTRAPLVSARVYFQPKDNPGNLSYGSGIPSYEVDGSGGVSPQGFVSTALSSPLGLGTESQAAVLDMALTVSLTGSGSGTVTSNPAGINCPTTCTAPFPDGTYVTLNGSPAAGSAFVGITGCDSYSVGQCTMSMSSSKNVTARFDGSGSGPAPTPTPGPTSFTLSVSRAGTGSGTVSSAPSGISCGATCSATFAQGTVVTLAAAPDSGSAFSGWGRVCSGTGSCSLTLSANQSATATFTAASAVPPPSEMNPRTGKRRPISNVTRSLGDQFLIGLRSDPRYQFVVTLFNAGVTQSNFELRATDDQGAPVVILDDSGSPAAFRRFNNLAPYQQVDLKDSDLGLDDGKHYVLKATTTKGTLLAFGTALDRKTLDLEQISDDGQASPAEDGIVSYWVAGVSRDDTSPGAHWRTDLRIFNRGSKARNLSFQYSYISDGVEHVAEVANPIAAGQLLTYDDVVAVLLARDERVDLSGSNAGILRIFYPEDDESPTRPLIIGSRNYDDDPAGTVGSQLAVYTSAQAGSPSHDLFLTGVEDSARYASRIGVFAMDPGRVTGRIVVVAPDGSQVGSFGFTLGGSSPHYGQISLTDPNMHFNNPGKPVSIRFDQLSGGRVGAYAFTADKVTLDTNFIQALPQN